MRKIWRRKWLVLVMTVAVFLSVGAVALATTNGSQADESTGTPVTGGTGAAVGTAAGQEECIGACGVGGRPGPGLRQAFRERAERWGERHQQVMEKLREDMTPADQALYDRLVQQAKEQREALQDARDNLMETLRQLRDLADKYLDSES